jgi:hypothetical protein
LLISRALHNIHHARHCNPWVTFRQVIDASNRCVVHRGLRPGTDRSRAYNRRVARVVRVTFSLGMPIMKKPSERRHFWRAVFYSPARLTTHDGLCYADLEDISLRGALVQVPVGWMGKAGDDCLLQFDLGRDASISMWACVSHVAADHVGLRCTSIDLDSITHLRRLVALNAGDPAVLERELSSLLTE